MNARSQIKTPKRRSARHVVSCLLCVSPAKRSAQARTGTALPAMDGHLPYLLIAFTSARGRHRSPIVLGLRRAAGDHSRSRPHTRRTLVRSRSWMDRAACQEGCRLGGGERGSPHSTTSVSTGLWLCVLATKRKITTKTCTNFSPTSEKSENKQKTNQTRQ